MIEQSSDSVCCPECQAQIPVAAIRCPACRAVMVSRVDRTINDEVTDKHDRNEFEIPRPYTGAVPPTPSPDEVFPGMWRYDLILIILVAIFGVGLSISLYQFDRATELQNWSNECASAFAKVDEQNPYWRVVPSSIAPRANVVYVVQQGAAIAVVMKEIVRRMKLDELEAFHISPGEWDHTQLRSLRGANGTGGTWLVVEGQNSELRLTLSVSYYLPGQSQLASFVFRRQVGILTLVLPRVLHIALVAGLALILRAFLVDRYRRKRRRAFALYEADRTRRIFQLQSIVDECRRLLEHGDLKAADEKLGALLCVWPLFREGLELRQRLSAPSGENNVISGRTGLLLYLRVVGTPYAYQAPSGARQVFVGRQRRKLAGNNMEGNDFVIRVPGIDQKSLRISRQHFEINRIDEEFFVIDRSTAGTKLNGELLVKDSPSRLKTGDQLQVAETLTLEVAIRSNLMGTAVQSEVNLVPSRDRSQELVVEASLGDMVTVDND